MIAIRAAVFNLLFYAISALMSVVGLPLLLGRWPAISTYSKLWARLNLAILKGVVGLDHRILGEEKRPKGPAVYAVKHQSAWDTLAFNLIVSDPVFVLKRELYFIPLYGLFLYRSGMIGIDRTAGAKALKQIVRDAKDRVSAGRSIVIFPEGTRTAPGAKVPYQPGVAALYRHLDCPVVPVALNSGLFWGRRSFMKRPGTITISFLDPVPPGLDRRTFMAEIESRIETECQALNAAAKAVD